MRLGGGVPSASQGKDTDSPTLTYTTSRGFILKWGGAERERKNYFINTPFCYITVNFSRV